MHVINPAHNRATNTYTATVVEMISPTGLNLYTRIAYAPEVNPHEFTIERRSVSGPNIPLTNERVAPGETFPMTPELCEAFDAAFGFIY